ncbi:4-alpha-glucanotransferase [Bosea sp. BE271]|uniref:4-alpha-glucanotransferase n=1 Tax=Bosea TaxID=85413 RepID=UPI0028565188|nr:MULTISPECIES: 4-alpha-glucanotransferase [Bosea]MDR6830946.1 4-alpha-glucanotransferase [Bosea robiniae]MDR6897321.1 4-alpha-glucanotransferase [Bosea sp. BE109]MDR7140718.1 4-alpha-glucanotransferase [Bosea sp. BE168]MDR7177810.1 4-alpha-glucanotransferase [Bosea sp. BE271]
MTDDLLRQLATRSGIAPEWTDQTGAMRQVTPDSLRAILRALGLPGDTDEALRNSLAAVEALPPSGSARFLTGRVGQPIDLPIAGNEDADIEMILEDGTRRILRAERAGERLLLPAFDQPGYHTIQFGVEAITVAVAPARCVTFSDLSGGRPGWGLAAQIYSLRSAHDGGIGNFAGAAALGRAAAGRGADALAISPVHALYGALPGQFSPYSPSTRLFYNPLHADPAAAFPDALLATIAAQAGLAEEMERLSGLDQIDWLAATPLRQRFLRALFDQLDKAGESRAAFERYATEASPLLCSHAIFEVLHATELARDPTVRSWRDWQPGYRDPDSPQVAAFAEAHAGDVRYQIFLQWLTSLSYGVAQHACREAGMVVGLIADLAIGMDGAGSHAWSRQDEVLHGLSIGAPPDYYAADGQNWALTTFSPRGLAASGYAPFIETLRASLRHVGGIRIDHVMGMSRLWLVPEGASALDGAYVSFPSETLFRLIALESWRHRAIVIGEDLGTLPYGFRDYLREQGVAGLRVLRFERTQHGYVRPSDWDRDAVALTSTHDLVPTAGWWAGSDLEADDAGEAEEARAWDRGVLWGAFRDAALAEGERPAPEHTDPVVDAAIRYVAATPCTLKIAPIEDALGLRVQPNVPGTTFEKPNWRHRLAGDAAHALNGDHLDERLAPLGARPSR